MPLTLIGEITVVIVGLLEIGSIVGVLAAAATCCFTKDAAERAFAARAGIGSAAVLIVTIQVAHVMIFGGKP